MKKCSFVHWLAVICIIFCILLYASVGKWLVVVGYGILLASVFITWHKYNGDV